MIAKGDNFSKMAEGKLPLDERQVPLDNSQFYIHGEIFH
jgi:hypothetical protein